jgi:hypothetical protein
MKVKILASSISRREVAGRFRAGTEYVVLCIEPLAGKNYYRLVTETDGNPALFDAALFELVDNAISSLWIVVQDGGCLEFTPEAWSEEGFWEAFFDNEPNAVSVYNEMLARLLNGE